MRLAEVYRRQIQSRTVTLTPVHLLQTGDRRSKTLRDGAAVQLWHNLVAICLNLVDVADIAAARAVCRGWR